MTGKIITDEGQQHRHNLHNADKISIKWGKC